MDTDLPLRERKKRQTRKAISEVATRLFIERGFDDVTVAEVAAAAEVSKMTVFNYFPTKEDLMFDDVVFLEERMQSMVRSRRDGESLVDVFRREFLASLDPRDVGSGQQRAGMLHGQSVLFWRTVEGSDSLKAREREVGERMVHQLARVIGDDLQAEVVASQIVAVYGVLNSAIRRRLLAGEPVEDIRAVVVPAAEQAFDSLANGITR